MSSSQPKSPKVVAMTIGAIAALGFVSTVLMIRRSAARGRGAPRKTRMRSTSCGLTQLMVSRIFNTDFELLITANVEFIDRMPTDAELTHFLSGLCDHTRFRSVPVQSRPGGSVAWMPQKVELRRHVFRHRANSAEAVCETRQRIINATLRDKSIPWWEVHIIERGYATTTGEVGPRDSSPRDRGDGGVLLLKIHHAVGDGVSLAEVFMGLIVDEAGAPVADAGTFAPRPAAKNYTISRLRSWMQKAASPFGFVTRFVHTLSIPVLFWDGKNILHDHTATSFPPHREQVPIFFPSHSLQLIKDIKNAVDPSGRVTVNDVEFALVAGCIRRCMIAVGHTAHTDESLATMKVRCLTPLAFPEKACAVSRYHTLLRNHFISIPARVPVAGRTVRERIDMSHRTWAAVKSSMTVPATLAVFHVVKSVFPLWYRQILARDLQHATSLLFSNVPGPQSRCFIGGAEIATAHIFCPNLNPYVGALSVNGRIFMAGSFYADLGVAPEAYAAAFRAELLEAAEEILGLSSDDVMRRGFL